MPRLQDPDLLARYRAALSNWRITGYVQWKTTAAAWVQKYLEGLSLRDVARILFEHMEAGGEIDQVCERRPEWNDAELD